MGAQPQENENRWIRGVASVWSCFFLLMAMGMVSSAEAGAPEGRLKERETLVYAIKWMGLPVGTLTASVKGITKIGGRDVYVLEAVGKTNAIVSAVHKIDARFVSYMDVEKIYPLRFEVFRRDGRGKGDTVTDFDQQHHKAVSRNPAKKTQKTFVVPERVQDILSACYYLMLVPLNPGDKVPYDIFYDEKNHHVFAFIESRIMARSSVLGRSRTEALVIRPYARMKGDRMEKGDVSAIYSCDTRRIPLWAVIKGPIFGHATILLIRDFKEGS